MIPRINDPDSHEQENSQRPRRQSRREIFIADVTAEKLSPASLDIFDNENSYEPNNEGNADFIPESAELLTESFAEIIDATDYVGHNYPLRPTRKSIVLNKLKTLERFRYYAEF
jgi:hypothetical protein